MLGDGPNCHFAAVMPSSAAVIEARARSIEGSSARAVSRKSSIAAPQWDAGGVTAGWLGAEAAASGAGIAAAESSAMAVAAVAERVAAIAIYRQVFEPGIWIRVVAGQGF